MIYNKPKQVEFWEREKNIKEAEAFYKESNDSKASQTTKDCIPIKL